MSINSEEELKGMQHVSDIVADTLWQMKLFAKPGISTRELDDYGGKLLQLAGARSAPNLAYKFPGHTCISINHQIAHGIPKSDIILNEGDLINIDVSAEANGYWADNGGSFILGEDKNNFQPLVNASKEILHKAIYHIKDGVRISEIGKLIETEAKKAGYTVIKNLAGHGVGRSLHEEPKEILNCYDRFNWQKFKKNTIVAVETFISTLSTYAEQESDGWTLVGNRGGYVAQHEHTIMVTEDEPVILTKKNKIWESY